MICKPLFTFLSVLLLWVAGSPCRAQGTSKEPWKANQLMPPAELAALLSKSEANLPLIFSIGPSPVIKGSIDVGSASEKANLEKLKTLISKLPKDADIVIYCGCCPFDRCPNIRPAFSLLNKNKFTHHRLLHLEHNIKIDWINKGYPRK